MDKKQLNQEIVLCRSEVKRARVCVIRRLVKQIKILRTSKDGKNKEKKFRKAKRLAAEIHMMKTLKPDYVTKFALTTENYVPTGSNTKLKRKRNACAKLSQHKHIAERVNKIRSKFNNWREEIPPLLVKVSKRRRGEAGDAVLEDDDTNDKDNEVTVKKTGKVRRKYVVSSESGSNNGSEEEDVQNQDNDDKVVEEEEEEGDDDDDDDDDMEVKKPKMSSTNSHRVKVSKPVVKKEQKVEKRKISVSEEEDDHYKDHPPKGKRKNKKGWEVENGESVVHEKVDDPFFIAKKVIVPKLLQAGSGESHTDNVKERKRKLSDDFEAEFKAKPNLKIPQKKPPPEKQYKRLGEPLSEEDLHPSWRAKKVQMIKPFEGKKIKFE